MEGEKNGELKEEALENISGAARSNSGPSGKTISGIQGIPFSSQIGRPLAEAIEKQRKAAENSWNFIENVGK